MNFHTRRCWRKVLPTATRNTPKLHGMLFLHVMLRKTYKKTSRQLKNLRLLKHSEGKRAPLTRTGFISQRLCSSSPVPPFQRQRARLLPLPHPPREREQAPRSGSRYSHTEPGSSGTHGAAPAPPALTGRSLHARPRPSPREPGPSR